MKTKLLFGLLFMALVSAAFAKNSRHGKPDHPDHPRHYGSPGHGHHHP